MFKGKQLTMLPVDGSITYENGADVPTSFVTNMDDPQVIVRTAPRLRQMIQEANRKNLRDKVKEQPKYDYPDEIITAAMVGRWCRYGVDYKLRRDQCVRVNSLDEQLTVGKSIFGGGLLLSERAAAERAAAERAAAERAAAERAAARKWILSEREREIVKRLG